MYCTTDDNFKNPRLLCRFLLIFCMVRLGITEGLGIKWAILIQDSEAGPTYYRTSDPRDDIKKQVNVLLKGV